MSDGPQDGEGSSIWDRLRRRKVAQWTLAYAAGAWGLLQGLQFVVDAFEWPSRVLKLGTVAALVGLPLVVAIAWFRGERGAQRVTRTELAVVTLLFLLGGSLFWYYQRSTPATDATEAVVRSPASAAAPLVTDAGPSIAVLPFENRSKLEDDAFFVDGIHDDILTQLSKVSALKVISRTSVEQFRDTKLPIKEIAGQLGVGTILEGGVQRGGERVRINVQLIDAATDAHLWAEMYDRELTAENIFAIQSEVAEAIAGALRAKLTVAEQARVDAVPTQSLAAWEAYQLGKQRMAKRTSESLAEAERFFRNAIDIDSKFALGYSGLADTLVLQIQYSGNQPEAALAEAEKAAARALELNPNLAEAWASRGVIAQSRSRWDDSERFLRRAIELNPNYATAHHWLSLTLRGGTRFQEEREHAERAAQLDPLSAVTVLNLGHTLERLGRFDEAAARYRRGIEIDPRFPSAYDSLASLDAYGRNRFGEAVPAQERAVALDPGNASLAASLAWLRHDLGDIAGATRLIKGLTERGPDDVFANHLAGFVAALSRDLEATSRHAGIVRQAVPDAPVALKFLRDVDLSKGDPEAAQSRYRSTYPQLMHAERPQVDAGTYEAAIDVALVLQRIGAIEQATALLDGSEQTIRLLPRLGWSGYGIADAQIHALRGDKAKALAALRDAEKAGWRGPGWRYYRDVDPILDSIRNEPEFKAVFADIDRDMARQRAELAARPKDTPLLLGGAGS